MALWLRFGFGDAVTRRFSKALLLLSGWMAAGWIFWKYETAVPKSPVLPEGVTGDSVPVVPAVTAPEVSPFEEAFVKWAGRPELRSALTALVLLDEEGRIVFSSALGETALCPASALKILTTGAAFGMLGPEFRFETRLIHRPDGNLALVGSGDPTLEAADLDALAAAAIRAGLKEVSGDLEADTTVFAQPPVDDHWNWGDIGNAYGAGAFGLNIERNRLTVSFQPGGKPGDPARFVQGGPVAAGTRWVNEVTTGPPGSGDGVTLYSVPFGRVISLAGTVPQGDEFTVGGAIPDPPALAVEVLRAALVRGGVKFSGKPVPRKGEAVVLASHRSAALPEIIDHLHKVSDNLETQCLFLTLGNVSQTDPATAVWQHWEKSGVTFDGLRLIDGSGLARANMIRPLDLARVNFAARHGPHGERFFQSLNVSLDGHARAKLGSMSGVKTDTGFLRMNDGRELTFALMANGLDPGLGFWPLRAELLEAIRNAE
jgi:D-alanyl-D-alanine carboxypeptidase/D-alanyl-D-alanine-endopeptidase (penicillin-binding protein 4)